MFLSLIITLNIFFQTQNLNAKDAVISNRKQVLDVFSQHQKLALDFKKTSDPEARRKLEEYTETKMERALKTSKDLILKNNDKELLDSLLKVIISNQNSASESYSYTLGEVFLENPEILKDGIGRIKDKKEKEHILKSLEWGWENAKYNEKDKKLVSKRDRQLKEFLPSNQKK